MYIPQIEREARMREETLLIVGNGVLAGHVLYILSHGTRYKKIVIGSRDIERASRKANTLQQHALNIGYDVNIEAIHLDLDNIHQTAASISKVSPAVIFNTASMQSWWVVTTLPDEVRSKVAETRFGPWLPMHLSPTLSLMEALRQCENDAIVVNAAFPDAVNPVLARNGLGPTVGIGNIANVVPALRLAVAEQLNARVQDVDVRICGHHYVSYRLSRLGHPDGAPVYFHASVNGTDVTGSLDQNAVFRSLTERHRRTGGVEGQPVTASSAVAVLEALQGRTRTLVHAPGPNGLPGGYPVWISKAECEISLPQNISLDEAVSVNETGQIHDGIESIDKHGNVRFAEEQMAAMYDLFGHQCDELRLADVHEFAKDLSGRYQHFLERNGLVH